jgi:hypothetical protein
VFLEPEQSLGDRALPFFIPTSEIIHSKRDTLQLRVLIKIVKIHGFTIPCDSDDDQLKSSDDSNGDGLPGLGLSLSTSLQPWPKVYRLAGESSSANDRWSSLPR